MLIMQHSMKGTCSVRKTWICAGFQGHNDRKRLEQDVSSQGMADGGNLLVMDGQGLA